MLLESPWVVQILLALSVLSLGLDSDPLNAPRVFLSFKGKGTQFLFGFCKLLSVLVSGHVVSEEPDVLEYHFLTWYLLVFMTEFDGLINDRAQAVKCFGFA